MTSKTHLVIFLTALLCGGIFFPAGAAGRDGEDIDEAARAAVVTETANLVRGYYVYPETGGRMAQVIRKKLAAGEYDLISDFTRLAARLTADLRAVSRDLHLRLRYDPDTAAALIQAGPEGTDLQRRRAARERRNNFGFARLENMAGNVGLLDLRFFADTAYARDTAVAAMAWLAHADAVIVDLRFNGGGSPRMVQFLCSYFFGPEPVHLNSLYWRPSDRTDEFWTLRELPGKRMPDVPLFILTSPRTFSGAEEFTYDLKNLERAVVVGETTGGGAHPVNMKAVGREIVFSIPVGRAINPVTGTDWEGTGVTPDMPVPAEQASAHAHRLALKAILEKSSDPAWNRELRRLIARIDSDLSRRR